MEKYYCKLHSFLDGDENCPDCKSGRVGLPVMQKIASIKEQALKGLLTDGGHHKQWFLEAILGMLTTEKEWLYLKEKEQWEEGIAP